MSKKNKRTRESLLRKNYDRSKYSFANINFLGKCNLDCLFCLGKDLETEFSKYDQLKTPPSELKNFDAFLELCKKYDVENIYVTGQNTDSLLYQHLDGLIDYLQEDWNFKIGLRTNGLLAKKKIDTINKCKKSISYTLLTLKPEVMKQIAGKSTIPDFDYIFKHVEIPQRVATVITKYNVDEIYDLIKFVSAYPQIRYFQIRRISTDTRYDQMKEHIEIFEDFFEDAMKKYKKIDEFELSPILDIYGVKTSFWRTTQTSVNSLNYFSNGVISDEYFIIEGYLNNKDKFLENTD